MVIIRRQILPSKQENRLISVILGGKLSNDKLPFIE